MTDALAHHKDERYALLSMEDLGADEARTDSRAEEGEAILIPVGDIPRRLHHPLEGFPSNIWRYMIDAKHAAFLVCRFDKDDGKKKFSIRSLWRSPDGEVEWKWKRPPAPLPLYKLVDIIQDPTRPVMICEGEKATDAAARIFPDHVVTCWQGGANAVRSTNFLPLAGRQVTIWPDNDSPGFTATAQLKEILFSLDCAIKVIDVDRASALLPDCPLETREADVPPKIGPVITGIFGLFGS